MDQTKVTQIMQMLQQAKAASSVSQSVPIQDTYNPQ
jgi:hypothetical protein